MYQMLIFVQKNGENFLQLLLHFTYNLLFKLTQQWDADLANFMEWFNKTGNCLNVSVRKKN